MLNVIPPSQKQHTFNKWFAEEYKDLVAPYPSQNCPAVSSKFTCPSGLAEAFAETSLQSNFFLFPTPLYLFLLILTPLLTKSLFGEANFQKSPTWLVLEKH